MMSLLLRVLSALSILFHLIHVTASVQQFTLVIQETWVHGKLMITANETLPGPTLTVNEDDDVVVTVINSLPNAFTTIHWHGMFQYGTPFFDGAVGVTQCAIGQAQQMTYQFKAKPAGTFWYHGHVNGQLIDGLYGALIVKNSYDVIANAQYKYNQNEWIWMISDWYHAPVATLRPKFLSSQNTHAMEPLPDGFMLNQFVSSKLRYNTTAPTTPSFFIEYNQTVRIRLINAAAVSMYSVSLDGLAMTIIEIDGVAVSPVTVSSVMLDAGQRVSVIVRMSELNAAIPTSWRSSHLSSSYPSIYARIESITSMFGVDDDMYRAYYNPSWQFDPLMLIHIVTDPINRIKQPSYNATTIKPQPGVEVMMPMPWNVTGTMTTADMEMMTMMGIDENCLSCRPIERQNAPSATHHLYLEITQSNDMNGIPRYYLNKNTFRMEDDMSSQPLLYQMITTALQGNMSTPSTTSTPTHMPDMNPTTSTQMPPHHMPGMDMGTTTPPTHMPGTHGDKSPTHSAGGGSSIHQNYTLLVADRFDLPFNTTVEIFINNTDTLSHPMHLHGHHFWVIATSADPSAETQYAPNYIRRDTAVVPAHGWLKIRFNTNNPGVWLLHCHMEWHMMAGLSTIITTGLPHLANLLRSTLPTQQVMEPCMKQNNWTFPNSVTGGMTGMTGMTGTTGMTGMTGTHGGGHSGSSHSHFPIHASVLTLLLIVVTIIIPQ